MTRLGPVLALALLLALGSACDESRADGDTPSGQGASSSANDEPTEDHETPDDDETPSDDDTPADGGDGESAGQPQPPLPVDRSCSSDDDCVVTRTVVEGRWVCCSGCELIAVSRSWKQTFDRFCDEEIPEPRTCPRYRCPMKDGRSRCRDGTCVVEPIPDE